MAYEYTWEPEGLYRKFFGDVSGEDILKSNFELHEDPKFEKIQYIINDFTEMVSHSIEIVHTKVYATVDDVISNSKGRLKIALVAIQADHVELAKSYSDQMEDKLFECKIFDTVEDARKWIGNN